MKFDGVLRISFGMVMMVISALSFAMLTGLIPDKRTFEAENRAKLCQTLATNIGLLLGKYEVQDIGLQMEVFAHANEDLLSMALRRSSGEIVVEVGEHSVPGDEENIAAYDGYYIVPLGQGESSWGRLEMQFRPLYQGGNRFVSLPMLKLLLTVTFIVGLTSWLHLKRLLKYLDPKRAVPARVRDALDNFAEGVVILDTDQRIVLVNERFAVYVDKTQDWLLGKKIWDLPLTIQDSESSADPTIADGATRDTRMQLADEENRVKHIFSVNSSPVLDDNGKNRGVLMAFNDVTPLERNRAALLTTLEDLSRSRQEIAAQNEELRVLATSDPLTTCLNRRSFFEQFEQQWTKAKNTQSELCGMMVDIDFFKSINDTYGHSTGDEVLRETGRLLKELARPEDIVCRYGGEEFSILMPGLDLDAAAIFGERIRIEMSMLKFDGFTITTSIGLSSLSLGGKDPQDMLDQADKCLYVAKRNGRNQVVRFDNVPEDLVVDESKISRTKPSDIALSQGPEIPYAAVSALVAALTYRDQQTGTHSNRVSTYAAMLAQKLMRPKEVYVVEMAALLHDIGKVGVPDAILLKPGKLNDDEWKIMERHDKIGIEIISKSFKHQGLTDIIRCHHYKFGGEAAAKQDLIGESIPIGARILTIVDSFDAMVSDRPYRKGMPLEDALAELVRCSGTQFDPELVAVFVSMARSGELTIQSGSTTEHSYDVSLNIGEQVERLVEAADKGDTETFKALTDRLRQTAEQHNLPNIAAAATDSLQAIDEEACLESLLEKSYAILSACRSVRNQLVNS